MSPLDPIEVFLGELGLAEAKQRVVEVDDEPPDASRFELHVRDVVEPRAKRLVPASAFVVPLIPGILGTLHTASTRLLDTSPAAPPFLPANHSRITRICGPTPIYCGIRPVWHYGILPPREAIVCERVFDVSEGAAMKFARTYSASGDAYSGITFEPRARGSSIPTARLFSKPRMSWFHDWSQVAVDVLAQKYCRKAGVPAATARAREEGVPAWLWRSVADGPALEALSREAQFGAERDARQVFDRMAGCWAYWGWKHGYFDSEDDAQVYFDEMCAMLARRIGAPNSPQWFNTGLYWAYGISGPAQGHWYVDAADGTVRASTDTFEHPQVQRLFYFGIPRQSRQRGRDFRRRDARSAHL